MRLKLILSLTGTILAFFGLNFLFPIIVGIYMGEDSLDIFWMFGAPMIASMSIGVFLHYYFHSEEDIRNREAFLLVTVAWILMVVVGALPFIASEKLALMSYEIGIAGAIFESMSGLSTTGATILDLESSTPVNASQYNQGYFDAPKSLLLWRSQTQWLGGMGIIVLATIIFSRLFGGGIQVLQAEMPGTGITRLKPQMAQTARLLWSLYLIMTVIEVSLLAIFSDMPLYDAICNSFSTVSTGGFSPQRESIGSYDSSFVIVVVTFFMLISGINFVILYYVFNNLIDFSKSFSERIKLSFKALRENEELNFYLYLVLFSFTLIFVNLILDKNNISSIFYNFIHASFQTVSLLTGTGFTTTNYMDWPKMSIFVLLLFMFAGGCAGSTTGGIKIVRIMLLFKALKRELILVIHPRAVMKLRIGDKVLDEDLFRNVGVFFFIFVILFLLGSLVTLYLEGNNPNVGVIDGISISLSCLANIGPGIGAIGPTGTYSAFGDSTLLFLSALMMLGRLEIITVLLLFYPDTYRD
ncbi:MAG TPA: TrkH family potassium uptake protein [Candidatus Poseidoniia archaeon]|nr:TrkH family potassium uptake protein [Candidatus Poseidoniia archaeon]|tara:strand:- start:1806 stop:3383 length:1578 start_codon:yes stop_codon:yes gene_type:complete